MFERNRLSFTDICNKSFGRRVIYTNAKEITKDNIVTELGKALPYHWQNHREIEYLDRYYSGDQPILYRVKDVRPEVNNKIVENHAFAIVEHKTAENFGEPVQYVLKGTDEIKSRYIKQLNDYMDSEDKGCVDIEIGRWRSICGTSYRFTWVDAVQIDLDEAPFSMSCEDPRSTFVVYFSGSGKKPAFSCQLRKTVDGKHSYFIYTDKYTFEIQNSKIIDTGINGMFSIPVVEYPNNERRISDIEIVITILDAINKIQSDRMNGIEQFVQAFMKFKNCDIDENEFLKMCKLGAIKVKTQQGIDGDVDLMTAELDQQQTQTAKDDLYDNMLVIEGMPDRQENSGGDTGQAVVLRNGFYFSEKRAELSEPIFKKSERAFLRIVLSILKTKEIIDLKLSDIEIKVTRSKTDNMYVKTQVLNLLLQSGIAYEVAIKVCNLFSDPEQVVIDSKPYLDKKYGLENTENPQGGLENVQND
jgi:SPP1 family phage portal protein